MVVHHSMFLWSVMTSVLPARLGLENGHTARLLEA